MLMNRIKHQNLRWPLHGTWSIRQIASLRDDRWSGDLTSSSAVPLAARRCFRVMWQILWSRRECKDSDGLILRMWWALPCLSSGDLIHIGYLVIWAKLGESLCNPYIFVFGVDLTWELNNHFKVVISMKVSSEAYRLSWPGTIAISSLAIALWRPIEQETSLSSPKLHDRP